MYFSWKENIDFMSAIEAIKYESILTRHETGAAFMTGMVGRLTGILEYVYQR